MYFYRYRGLGVAPVVGYGIKIGATAAAKKIFGGFGPSAGFQARQAASDQFFATRRAIAKLEPQMTPEQFREWKALPHHKADYNLRRENETERSALYGFLEKLQTPQAWVKPAVPGVVTPAVPGVPVAKAGILESPVLLIAIAGLAAFLFLA